MQDWNEIKQILVYLSLTLASLLSIMTAVLLPGDLFDWIRSKNSKKGIESRNRVIVSIVITLSFLSIAVTFIKQHDNWLIGLLYGGAASSLIMWTEIFAKSDNSKEDD